jgi:hypothetical protein
MAIDLSIVNAALTRTGNDPITALNDGSPAGTIAGQNYEPMVRRELTGYPWRWATTDRLLTALSATPNPPWLVARQLPTDLLELRTVMVAGLPIDYEVMSDKLMSNVEAETDVFAKFTWRVFEVDWPGDFTEAMTQMLEPIFLRGIGERFREADARAKDAVATMRMARSNDAKRAAPRNPVVSPTLAARSGTIVLTTSRFFPQR